MRTVWLIPVIASILILGFIASGIAVYAEAGNTTIDEFIISTKAFFDINDPDGISTVVIFVLPVTFTFDASCSNTVEVEIPLFRLPVTMVVTDCQANPDVTVWLIDSTGATCIEGSCLLDVVITSDVNDNVSVDPGETGLIDGATVNGNVQVNDGDLTITGGSTITGNVEVSNGGTVTIQDGSTVQGNVIVSGDGSVLEIENATVDGNIETQNVDSVTITGTNINGNIKSDNDGDVTITGNTVNGNIEIISPSGTCSTSPPNTVNGNNPGCP